MPRPIPLLLVLSREQLSLTQEQLATLVGSSLRTVQRWENKRSTPSPWNIHALADAVRSHDETLAAELDAWAPRPKPPEAPLPPPAPALIAMPSPMAPPPPPPPPPIADDVLVDAVVCAAAEAMELTPRAIRPAVLAAFRRASDARLTAEAVVRVLSSVKEPAKGKSGAREG
jgi:transcriptional regulator with XRE-family HTH domain